MRLHSIAIISVLLVILLGGTVWAQNEGTQDGTAVAQDIPADGTEAAPQEPQLTPEELAKQKKKEEMHADFTRFSDIWIAKLNNSHTNSFSNIKYYQDGDVTHGRYHRIEKRSSVVRESRTMPGIYTGILRYQDTEYECAAATKEECVNGEFFPVSGTAKAFSEIFQYKKGVWK